MDSDAALEPIFTNFILKIEALKSMLHIMQPKYSSARFNKIMSDSKIDNVFIHENPLNKKDMDIVSIIELRRLKIFSCIFPQKMEDELLHYAYGYHIDIMEENIHNKISNDLMNIEKTYNNKISYLVDKYLSVKMNVSDPQVNDIFIDNSDDTINKASITEEYNNYLLTSRMSSKIHDVFSSIMNILNKIELNNPLLSIQMKDKQYETIKTLIRNYNNYNINAKLEKIDRELCEVCNIRYTIDHEKGEIFCKLCGLLSNISDDMYDSTFSLSTEGRSKNSMYVSSGHCEFWFKRIFALEPTDMKEQVISSVRQWLIKNNYPITCEYIRKALQKLKLPTYNTHVSLIRKLLTGKVPEPPSYKVKIHIFNDFNLAVQIYSEIYQDNNIKYYPYFIWKIIEILYWDQPRRRHEIFECIHLQNLDTLKKNDKIWKRICSRVSRFKFRPTDRNEQYIYFE